MSEVKEKPEEYEVGASCPINPKPAATGALAGGAMTSAFLSAFL